MSIELNWIISIYKSLVILETSDGVAKSRTRILKNWSVMVDKVDDFVIVKLVNANKESIHLCMTPIANTSIIWYDIDEIYKKYEK